MTHDSNPQQLAQNLTLSDRIIAHMNADHSDALLLYVRAFAHIGNATAARMVSIDRTAMNLEYEQPTGRGITHISFKPPLKDLNETRARLVELVNEARRMLGIS